MFRGILFLIVCVVCACGGDAVPVRDDIDRPCYDECERNADCLDGLACSELMGHVCVPIKCIECWAGNDRLCVIDEDYSSGEDYPVCTYRECK